MTIEEMKNRKRECGYSYAQLSELSGVPLSTIQKVFSGETKSPRYDTLQALSRILESGKSAYRLPENNVPLRDSVSAYGLPQEKVQGEYTVEDYNYIPEDKRVELIDGVIYDMTAPVSFHQLAVGEIYRQIADFILQREGSCLPIVSPIDVQLDRDNRTMVQPDVIIVCDPDIYTDKNIYGAPDFVLEIISPGTRKKDYYIKLRKYEKAGVREYWIVDPYQKVIVVHFFESPVSPTIYPLDADVPVNLYEGELVINISRLMKWLPKMVD